MPRRYRFAPTLLALLLAVPCAAAPVGAVSVRVNAWTEGGDVIRNAYVALVPQWRLWSAPLVEEIAGSGSAVFRVPPGTYYAVCGAKGYQASTEGPFSLLDASGGNLDVTLEPLVQARGLVTDERGQPLSGVRVSDTRGAILPSFDRFSELAVRHLSSDWSTVTDADGNWRLAVPEGTVPLVFAAEGRAAQWRSYQTGDRQPPLDVAMSAGAVLRVTSDRVDPRVVLTLERQGPESAGIIPLAWQRQVWAQWAKTPELRWTSLPPGEYAIYGKYPDPPFFMQRAAKLATVMLGPDQSAEVRVALPPERKPARQVARLFLEKVSAQQLKIEEVEAFAFASGGGSRRVRCFVEEAVGGTVFHLDADEGQPPFHVVTADRFIAATSVEAQLPVEGEAPLAATSHPRADGSLVIQSAEKDLPLPRAGRSVWRNCAKVDRVTVPVDVQRSGLARFLAPAGCKSGSLSFTPFEPVLLPAPLRPGDQSLGEVVLRAAASADVRVTREPDGVPVSGATVRVIAAGDDPWKKESILAADGVTGADGWVHLEVPPLRDLQFTASGPAGELSVTKEARGEPRGTMLIDPLPIPKPAALVVAPRLDAAIRERFPSSRVLSILARPVDPRRLQEEKRQQNLRPEDSEVRFEPLRPGTWKVSAIVRVAGTFCLLDVDEVELRAGETRRLDPELAPLVFRGRVTAGGKGVAARITFDSRSVPAAVKQQADSVGDGTFTVALPAKGTYDVEAVLLDAQSDDIPAGEIDFDDPSRPTEIRLPDMATVLGRVRAAGEPVANARVVASLAIERAGRLVTHRRSRIADARGEVTFEHLVPGNWVFSVRDEQGGRGTEKPVALRLSETKEVTVELEALGEIRGTVRDASARSVPHARIDCRFAGEAGMPARSTAQTDADGRFTVDLPPQLLSAAFCSVIAPSGIVDAFRAPAGKTVDVRLPAETAALRIDDWGKWYSPDTFWLAAPDGRLVSLSAAAELFPRSGQALQIPALALGRWKVIRVQSIAQSVALVTGQAAALPPLAEVALDRGRTSTIHLYQQPADAGGAN